MSDFASTLEHSGLAAWVNSSPLILGSLSGLHLLGFTLLVGTALVAGLRSVRYAFADRPAAEVTRTAARVTGTGFLLSALTGFLLVSPRAASAFGNWIFVLKMTLLLAAVIAQLAVGRLARRSDAGSPVALTVWGIASTVLWLAVAVAGCAFILLE